MKPGRLNTLKTAAVLGLPILVGMVLASTHTGLTVVQQRVAVLFVFAALAWILEPWPIHATSVLVITIELVWLSDAAWASFRPNGQAHFGELLSYREIMATFASPVIQLFLGGFFLAAAATKYRLDQNLARVLLRPFGDRPTRVMLGIMVVTATFSMFMSNTATTAMMLAILMPIMHGLAPDDRGRKALLLAVPVAANLGGVGTPIGTPPNAIALKYLTGEHAIAFGEWMSFGVPFVVVMVGLSWWLLQKLYPFAQTRLVLNLPGTFLRTPQARIVYGTFVVTILLWLTDFLHGMNAYVVALIPVSVFLVTDVINKEDLKKLNWDVLWLVAGGIALGLALEASGLARELVAAIPFDQLGGWLVLALAAAFGLLMANFLSNTATANLLLPIVAALSQTTPALAALGGEPAAILGVTLAISLGMCLPISTPPNALAAATGQVSTPDLARVGLAVGLVGLLLIFALLAVLQGLHFF